MTRKEKWLKFFEEVDRLQHRDAAPAFIQEITIGGLWSVQELVRRQLPTYSTLYQLLIDPPKASDFEAYYTGWPGDHRGWMRFESREEARDFYKFATKKMSFDDYRSRPQAQSSQLSQVRIDLNDNGNFAAPLHSP